MSGPEIPPVASHIHTMDRLPPELWARVCDLSDIRSLKMIRLTDSTLAQIAARYLFEGLCVILIPEYLDKLTEVAFHPTLRFHVRTLYFDHNILDEDFADYDEWKAEVDYTGDFYGEESDCALLVARCSQADLDRSYKKFCRLLASQKALFKRRMDLAVLSAALAMLPNLQAIKSMEKAFGYDLSPIRLCLQRDTLLPAPFHDYPSGIARPLASLISGLGLTRKQILTVDVVVITWSSRADKRPSGCLHDVQQLIRAAFRDLESMIVEFDVNFNDLEFRWQGVLPNSISSFVGAAPKLRLLDINFHWSSQDAVDPSAHDYEHWRGPPVGQLFATLTLPNLAIFRLEFCELAEKSLEDFLSRHATTLKEIKMDEVILDNRSDEPSSWEKTLKYVAPNLFLDCVSLQSICCDNTKEALMPFKPGTVDFSVRANAYYQALMAFLLERGRMECPSIADYTRP